MYHAYVYVGRSVRPLYQLRRARPRFFSRARAVHEEEQSTARQQHQRQAAAAAAARAHRVCTAAASPETTKARDHQTVLILFSVIYYPTARLDTGIESAKSRVPRASNTHTYTPLLPDRVQRRRPSPHPWICSLGPKGARRHHGGGSTHRGAGEAQRECWEGCKAVMGSAGCAAAAAVVSDRSTRSSS